MFVGVRFCDFLVKIDTGIHDVCIGIHQASSGLQGGFVRFVGVSVRRGPLWVCKADADHVTFGFALATCVVFSLGLVFDLGVKFASGFDVCAQPGWRGCRAQLVDRLPGLGQLGRELIGFLIALPEFLNQGRYAALPLLQGAAQLGNFCVLLGIWLSAGVRGELVDVGDGSLELIPQGIHLALQGCAMLSGIRKFPR